MIGKIDALQPGQFIGIDKEQERCAAAVRKLRRLHKNRRYLMRQEENTLIIERLEDRDENA